MARLRVDRLEKRGAHWVASIVVDETAVEVSAEHGSWQTLADENGVVRDVHPWIAASLQEHVRAAERKLARAA